MPTSIKEMLSPLYSEEATEEKIYNTLRLTKVRCATAQDVADFFAVVDDFLPFLVDSEHKGLSRLAKRYLAESNSVDPRVFVADMLEKYSCDLSGLELKNASGTQFAVFLPDATEQGRFRYSLFDEHGFFGHITRDSYEELLVDAVQSGYRQETSGNLERLCLSDTFTRGNELTQKIMRVNSGEAWSDVFQIDQQNKSVFSPS